MAFNLYESALVGSDLIAFGENTYRRQDFVSFKREQGKVVGLSFEILPSNTRTGSGILYSV